MSDRNNITNPIIILLAASLIIVNGCDIIDVLLHGNSPDDEITFKEESVAESFSSSAGGELNTESGVTIIAPIGAIPSYADGADGSMVFSIESYDSIVVELPDDEIPILPVYRFGPDGFNFARPVTIGFPVPDNIDMSNEIPTIWRLNPSTRKLDDYPAIYDPNTNLITTKISHFSSYFPTIGGSIFTEPGSGIMVGGSIFTEPGSGIIVGGSMFTEPGSGVIVGGSIFTEPGSGYSIGGSLFDYTGVIGGSIFIEPGSGYSIGGNWPTAGEIAARRERERGCLHFVNTSERQVRLCITNYSLKYSEQDVPGIDDTFGTPWLDVWNHGPGSSNEEDWFLPKGIYDICVEYKHFPIDGSQPYYTHGYIYDVDINTSASRIITDYVCQDLELGRATDFVDGRCNCIPTPTIPVGTGDIQVTLTWFDEHALDLDLWVTDPNGEKCYYGNTPSSSGGALDRDNLCSNYENGKPENIYWTQTPQNGEYIVEVNWFSDCGNGNTGEDYSVRIIVNGNARTYSGMIHTGTTKEVARFTIGNSKSSIVEGNNRTYYPEFKLPPK